MNRADPATPRGGSSHLGDGNDNDNSEGEEETEGGEKGTENICKMSFTD